MIPRGQATMQRVLVIDDDEMVRGALSMTLRASGYTCTTAANTPAGIALAEAEPFDIALIDINMPGLDGFEAVKAIAHIKPSVAIVAMSGRPEQSDPVSAVSLGAQAFMEKPFRRQHLFAALNDAVKAKPRG